MTEVSGQQVPPVPPKRFRNPIWAKIDGPESARQAVKDATGWAGFVGVVSLVFGFFAARGRPLLGITSASMVDGVFFLALCWGIWRNNRFAAILAFLGYCAEVAFTWTYGPSKFSVIQVFGTCGLLSGVRGTMYLKRGAPWREDLLLPSRLWIKRLAWGMAAIVVLGVWITAEAMLNGTVLLIPSCRWVTRAIPDDVFSSETGDYRISFKGTRLDWRKQSNLALGESNVKHLFLGHPGMMLAIWEEPGDNSAFSDEQILVAKLGLASKREVVDIFVVPAAVDGKFFFIKQPIAKELADKPGEQATFVEGVYRLPNKILLVRLMPFEQTDGKRAGEDDVAHDIAVIVKSISVSTE